jgi:hypothetical protein
MANYAKTITLSDGRTAGILKGKGRDVAEAQKQAGTDSGKFMGVAMSLLVHIDGESLPYEDLLDLPMEDYINLQGAFSEVNFSMTVATEA